MENSENRGYDLESYYDNDPTLLRLPRLNYKFYKFRGLEVAHHKFYNRS